MGREETHRIRSTALGNERSLWIRRPSSEANDRPLPLLLLLDGELYRDQIDAGRCLERLEAAGEVAPALTVFVSTHTSESRWRECPCHPPFARFILEELLPWLEARYQLSDQPADRVIAGASYTGLAAAFTALEGEGRLGRVLAQSGSFWSEGGKIVRLFEERPRVPIRFYLVVGAEETQAPLEHRPDVVQEESQLAVNRRLRDVLQGKGYRVDYEEVPGGSHHSNSWRESLPEALRAVLGRRRCGSV